MSGRAPKHAGGASRRSRWLLAALSLAIVAIAIFVWPQSSVEMDERGYAIALALYRACNQSDGQAINQIEQILDEWVAEQERPSEQQQAIGEIIADAKQEQWAKAARACRELLDAQAKR